MIYRSHYNNKAYRVAHSLKISNRSLPYLKLNYYRASSLSRGTSELLIAAPAMTGVTLRSPAHISIESKKCISSSDAICIKSIWNCKRVHFHNANVETAASLVPIVNRSIRLLDLIALSTRGITIMAPRWPIKFPKNIRLRMELKPKTILQDTSFTSTFKQRNGPRP